MYSDRLRKKVNAPDSDVDLAVLLPPDAAKTASRRRFFEVQLALEEILLRDVDLINLRQVSTVFQNEIIHHGRKIYVRDESEVDEFEILVMALYQKLIEERADILRAGMESGFYPV